jgi:hypothetical protein
MSLAETPTWDLAYASRYATRDEVEHELEECEALLGFEQGRPAAAYWAVRVQELTQVLNWKVAA